MSGLAPVAMPDLPTPHLVRWGGLERCPHVSAVGRSHAAVIHACKDPCHRAALRYTERSLPKDHPHYLAMESVHQDQEHENTTADLYLNLIDPPIPLFQVESFRLALHFVAHWIRTGDVLVHCNKGESRAPSIVILWEAKAGLLPDDSYQHAAAVFKARGLIVPYAPGKGIEEFLKTHWHEVIE